MKNNETKDLCIKCGGKCCINHPCHFFPKDFKEITVKAIQELFDKGFCLNYWEDSPVVYFVQPKIKSDSSTIQALWGNYILDIKDSCIFLKEDGCSLSWKDRGTGGKGLVATKDKGCIVLDGCSKEDCKNSWIPYQDILMEANNTYIQK